MVKNLFLLILLAGLSITALCQDRFPVGLKDTQVYLNILDPGVEWEKKISDTQSLAFGFGLTVIGDEDNNSSSNDIGISLNPVITADFRNYYARKREKKDLNPNSGNYIAVRAGYYFDSIVDNLDFGTTEISRSFFIGPVWGIQRNYKSGIHFGLSLGAGIATGKNTNLKSTFIGDLQLGFAITK